MGTTNPYQASNKPCSSSFSFHNSFFNSKIPLIQLILLDSTSTYSHYTILFSRELQSILFPPNTKHIINPPSSVTHPPGLGILRKVGRHENQLLRWHLGAHELRILHHLHRDEARHGRAHAVSCGVHVAYGVTDKRGMNINKWWGPVAG